MSSTLIRRAILLSVVPVAAGAIAVSGADGQTGRTITLAADAPTRSNSRQIDERPRELSLGDRSIVALTLRADKRVAGRAHVVCSVADLAYEGQDCDWILVLPDGTITASGGGLDKDLPGQQQSPPRTDYYAVTGGTGTYAGASGVLKMRSRKDDSSTITLSLS